MIQDAFEASLADAQIASRHSPGLIRMLKDVEAMRNAQALPEAARLTMRLWSMTGLS